MFEEYPSNSFKSKEEAKEQSSPEKKKIEKVVTGKVVRKNEIRKLTDVFISEDVHNVKSYILMDVLVPAIKDAIEDIVTNGIRMMLRGDTAARKSSHGAAKVSYRDYYDGDRFERRRSSTSDHTPVRHSYDDIVLQSRGDAERVLEQMRDIIEMYQVVSVADFFELVDLEKESKFTDNKYGWTNIRNADVVRVRHGYVIKLPKPVPID